MEKEEYYQQLHAINQLLEECPEGPEKTELLGLKQNIEELISLTNEEESDTSVQNEIPIKEEHNGQKNNSELDDEYAMFMAEMAKEGALESADTQPSNSSNCSLTNQAPVLKSSGNFKDLEGKKFRAPHTHQWGQLAYHNAMVCFVPDEIPINNEFEVKVLFLNPTHIEMQPCPYYFHSEKNCNFTEEQCRFSHGEAVSFSSLKEYIEPKFEHLSIGSSVLAKQSNDLWYRAKITSIIKEKEKCLVKFESKNVDNQSFEGIDFAHILPLKADCGSDDDSGSDSNFEEAVVDFDIQLENDCLEAKRRREELINMSLMRVPEQQPLGDWEKHTKGIGSKLMQKMGYIVGTGLGKDGEGIVKPVTAMILPQGKSLDYCMNLKETLNNPNLFDAEHRAKPVKKKLRKLKRFERQNKRKVSQVQLEKMDIDQFIKFRFSSNKVSRPLTKDKEYEILKEKLKSGSDKDLNVANFIIERNLTQFKQNIEELKLSIKRLEEVHADSQNVWKRLHHRELDVKSLNTYKMLITNEIDRRKDNKKMAVF